MPRKVVKMGSKKPSGSQVTGDPADGQGVSGLNHPPQQAPQMPALARTGLAAIASQEAIVRKLQSQRDKLWVEVLNTLRAASTTSLPPADLTLPVPRRGRDYSSSDSTSDTESSTAEDSSSEVSSKKKKKGMGKKKKRQRRKLSKRAPKRKRRDYSSSESESTSSSDDSSEERRPKKKKSKKEKGRHFPQRVKDVGDVQQRYDVLLRKYKKCRSLKMTVKRYDIDKVTIRNTAVIAEIAIAAPDVIPPPQGEGQTLLAYANSVKAFINGLPEVKETIKKMKKDKMLLPV